jgi:hypothetical protein
MSWGNTIIKLFAWRNNMARIHGAAGLQAALGAGYTVTDFDY